MKYIKFNKVIPLLLLLACFTAVYSAPPGWSPKIGLGDLDPIGTTYDGISKKYQNLDGAGYQWNFYSYSLNNMAACQSVSNSLWLDGWQTVQFCTRVLP